jgi:hypothetical protein
MLLDSGNGYSQREKKPNYSIRVAGLNILSRVTGVIVATLQEIKDIADSWLAARWPTVQSRQATYASNHGGRFFQGLRTHGTFPTDAVAALADLLDSHPTDQAETWNDAIAGLPANWPIALVMDVYNGPEGWGYVGHVFVYVSQLDRIYTRSQNVGSETWRTSPWREVTLNPIIG